MTINNFNSTIQSQEMPLDLRTNITQDQSLDHREWREEPLDLRINRVQEMPLDLCTNITQDQSLNHREWREEPLDLRINRVQYETLGLPMDQNEELMDISRPSVFIDLSRPMAEESWSQVNFGASISHLSPNIFTPTRKILPQEWRKKIIDSATIDSNGNIIALNFSKMFSNQRALCKKIFEDLDIIFERSDIYKTVKKIILKQNKLCQLPKKIITFTNLQSIDLSNNKFKTIPFQIYYFKKLKKLVLKNNAIDCMSTQIGRLKNLEELDLSRNNIKNIHRKLFSLKKLHTLDLSYNEIDDIPTSIQKLHNLETLKMSSNNLFIIPSEIFGKNLEYLDLSDNHVDIIPITIKNSCKLRDINFDDNEIVNIPDEVGDLLYLTAICLNDNATLRGFSDSLYNLLPNCAVEINNSGIALSTLLEIKNRSEVMDYNGPTFEFSIEAAEERIEARLVDLLYVYTSRNLPKSLNNLRSISDQLEMWLNRLNWISDFHSDFQQGNKSNPGLPEAIIDCIEYAAINDEYLKLFKNIIEITIASCGDGIALSIIDIGIAKQVLTFMESNQIVELSDFLLRTAFPLQILQKIAGQKITFLRLEAKQREIPVDTVDDVEVYLTYPISLKKKLNLSININTMVTRREKIGVTDEDLDIATLEVQEQQSNKEACAEFLINNTYWTELLKKLHPEEYERINERSIEMMDESDETAQEYRRNSLISLSGVIL